MFCKQLIAFACLGVATSQACAEAPVANDDSVSTVMNTPLSIPLADLIANDSDADADELRIVHICSSQNGLAALDKDSGFISYTPNNGFIGSDQIVYTVQDGSAGYDNLAWATINITVDTITPPNDMNTPPMAGHDAFTLTANTFLEIPYEAIFANDIDIDGDPLILVHVSDNMYGQVKANTETRIITFTPTPGFVGQASFNYTLTDGFDGGDWALMAWAKVSLTVESDGSDPIEPNIPPVAANDAFAVNQNTPLVIGFDALLENDTDANNDPIIIMHASDWAHGEANFDAVNQTITFTPETDFIGEATFNYTITDGFDGGDWSLTGWAQVSINVGEFSGPTPVDPAPTDPEPTDPEPTDPGEGTGNTPPIGISDTYYLKTNTPLVMPYGELLGNDTDIDNDALLLMHASDAENGTVTFDSSSQLVTFTPASDFIGKAGFNYTLTDGFDGGDWALTSYAHVTITVSDAPREKLPAYKTFWFGHSLVNHDNAKASIPYWLSELSYANGKGYASDGIFGQILDFVEQGLVPPSPHRLWGIADIDKAWFKSFADTNYDAVLMTAPNFIQTTQTSPYDPYWVNGVPMNKNTVDYGESLFEGVRDHEPGVKVYIYENWPDIDMFHRHAGGESEAFPPSLSAFQLYKNYTRDTYHQWHLDWQDGVNSRSGSNNVKIVPVGSVIAGMLSDIEALRALEASDLFEDSSHGYPSLYFLAALIHYSALYAETAPVNFAFPSEIHPLIQDNYPEIVNYIWLALQGFNDLSGESRVF
jgi:hypothetical protein